MALTKTETIDVIDAWSVVAAGALGLGTAEDVSGNYESLLYIEVALIEAVAQEGVTVIVQVCFADVNNWVTLHEFKGTAETPGTTTINDADVGVGDSVITLTDATTDDFDVKARRWFIKDGTIGNSESVITKSNAAHAVTICDVLTRAHANGLSVYDRVDEWCVPIPFAASQVRVLVNNTDADSDVAKTTRISKVTAIS